MLVLGIDPGTATTGYGFVKFLNSEAEVLDYGLIETLKDSSPEARLASIYSELSNILLKFKPDIVAVEKLFFATNVKTATRVGQACGGILLSAAQARIPVYEYAPGEIKKAIAGNGRADKIAMQKAVRLLLGAGIRKKKGKKTHFDNAADALAVALCHGHKEASIDFSVNGGDNNE